MENKGLNYIHGIIASVLALLSLLFGGYLLIPLFGIHGAFLGSALIAIIGIVLAIITKTKPSEVFPFALPNVKNFFGAFFMFVGVTMLNSSLSLMIGRVLDAETRDNEIEQILSGLHPLLAVFLVAVIPAVCEEFFCRGFLVRCFSRVKNEKLLIAIIAVIFGILHLDPYTFFPTAIMGAFFCYIALKTRSLLIPILFHFGNNALSTVLMYTGAGDSSAEETVNVFKIHIGASLGMSVLYLGLAVLPFYVGYRMFKDQKLFNAKLAVAFIISFGLVNLGSMVFAQYSYSLEYTDKISTVVTENEYAIDLEADEAGDYILAAQISSNNNFVLEVVSGDTVVYTSESVNQITLNEPFKHIGGELKIVLHFETGEENTESALLCYYRLMEDGK